MALARIEVGFAEAMSKMSCFIPPFELPFMAQHNTSMVHPPHSEAFILALARVRLAHHGHEQAL
jgi:hypothetical protein